jgi:hypothetical protein
LAHFHKAFHLERNEGFPNGRTGNLQLLSQISLGRQSCSDRKLAVFDLRLNLKRNLLVEAAGVNDSKSHSLLHWQHDDFFLRMLSEHITQRKMGIAQNPNTVKRLWEKFLHSRHLWRNESGPRRMEPFG